jgi:hypothetical protein
MKMRPSFTANSTLTWANTAGNIVAADQMAVEALSQKTVHRQIVEKCLQWLDRVTRK